MPWHAEVLALTLRRFVPGESYNARDKFASVATAQVLNGSHAYISGFLNDGTRGPIHRHDWRDMARVLRLEHGILLIDSERHGADKSYDTGLGDLA